MNEPRLQVRVQVLEVCLFANAEIFDAEMGFNPLSELFMWPEPGPLGPVKRRDWYKVRNFHPQEVHQTIETFAR